ncbi:MAG: NUDIX hydrolase [Cryomorphaceae bacterium]|nr:NUDIX hydrolase [Flavobacteriales bacterium]
MYKVFFNDKSILLTDRFDLDEMQNHSLHVKYDDFEELHYVINLLENSKKVKHVIIEYDELEVLWADFRAHYREIDAAGGVVTNGDEEILLIHRNGIWDLPKGKIENGESNEEGAVREVKEECGLSAVKLGSHLVDTFHIYYQNGFRILKKTFWYHMQSNDKTLIPQKEEGIDRVVWANPKELAKYPSYPSIEMVFGRYAESISQL